jgi:hypothetical protein
VTIPIGRDRLTVKPSAKPTLVRTQHLPPPAKIARELGFPGLAGLLVVVPRCFVMCRCEPLRSSGYGHMADGIRPEPGVHRTASSADFHGQPSSVRELTTGSRRGRWFAHVLDPARVHGPAAPELAACADPLITRPVRREDADEPGPHWIKCPAMASGRLRYEGGGIGDRDALRLVKPEMSDEEYQAYRAAWWNEFPCRCESACLCQGACAVPELAYWR